MSGAVRPAASSPRTSGVKAGESGSTPSRSKRSSSPESSIRKASPNRRGSVNQSSRPSSRTKRARRNRSSALRSPLVQPHPLGGVERAAVLDQHQVAGHPQVHDQRLRPAEPQQQVLAAPPETLDRPARHRPAEPPGCNRPRPARVIDLEPLDPPPLDLGLELAADGLDLGELRHPPFLADRDRHLSRRAGEMTITPRVGQALARGWARK